MNKKQLFSIATVIAAVLIFSHAINAEENKTQKKSEITIPFEKFSIAESAKQRLKHIGLNYDEVIKDINKIADRLDFNITKEELQRKKDFIEKQRDGRKLIIRIGQANGTGSEYAFVDNKISRLDYILIRKNKINVASTFCFTNNKNIDWISTYFPEKDFEVTVEFSHKRELRVKEICFSNNYSNKDNIKNYRIKFEEIGKIKKKKKNGQVLIQR